MSPMLQSTGGGSLCGKIWEEGVTDKAEFEHNLEDIKLSYAKEIFCRLSTMHGRDKQTN